MLFNDFICFDALVARLNSTARDEIIHELTDALAKANAIDKNHAETIAKAVIKRENEASTGLGKTVAVPHVKTNLVNNIVATVGLCQDGADFASLDKQPVYSIILLVSPENQPDRHLQAMECVFKNLQNEKFRKFLRHAKDAFQIEDLLKEVDENSDF